MLLSLRPGRAPNRTRLRRLLLPRMDRAILAGSNSSTIRRQRVAGSSAMATSSSVNPVSAIIVTTDDAAAISVDVEDSDNSRDNSRTRRAPNRLRAHRWLPSFPMERPLAGSIRSERAVSSAAPRTAISPSRATRTCLRMSCGSSCCAAATRCSRRRDTIIAIA